MVSFDVVVNPVEDSFLNSVAIYSGLLVFFHVPRERKYLAGRNTYKQNYDLQKYNLYIGVGTMGAIGAIVSIKFILWGQHT